MDAQQLIVAGLAVFSVGALGMVFLEPLLSGAARAEKRQLSITGGATRKHATEEAGNRRKQVADALKDLEQRQGKTKLTLEQRFEQAGIAWTRKTFILFSIASGLVLGFLLLIFTSQPVLGFGGGLVIGGLGFPRWYLSRKAKKRQKLFIEELPNAIDAIVRGIKSGLPLNDCVRLVANEARDPLKSEFRSIVEAQQMGISMADAVVKIYDRIPLTEVNFFGIVIQIQSKSGGNLGEILLNLSKVIRDRKRLRDKVDAMSGEAKSSAMIIGALPILVGVLTYFGAPDYISLLWTTKAGQIGLGACVSIMLIGILVMRKMIDFDI